MHATKRSIITFAAATVAAASLAHATPLGLNTDPGGATWDRGDADTAYAVWDSFPSFQFTNDSPDSSSGVTSPFLSQSGQGLTGDLFLDQGGGVYDYVSSPRVAGDDVLHTGGFTPTFTITGTTSFEIGRFYFQVKRTKGDIDLAPTLNGIAADGFTSTTGVGDTTHSSGEYRVTTYFGNSSLAGESITDFALSFEATSHLPIDALVVDAAVPEPAGIAVAAIGAMAVFGRRRRRA